MFELTYMLSLRVETGELIIMYANDENERMFGKFGLEIKDSLLGIR